ncbi:hypothetical protein [Commensalibacter papalotli (ex Botero et al. 2024)]|uniref:Uncharacterized protein n=1 Tax=Commensalibacter papalotli (ex Botero et al. 2024) TaxID=2972766 RepID=A0ABM9HPB2_9PROT|nr:hypothetical protein [Commensalibacter papalotli (ex Botero et al. 2024)]CAI3941568.1 unnamed protein product [Commensalibacter papalotli (ex Botero et al. 2024)]
MVFQWFKNKNKTTLRNSSPQQRLLIPPILQNGHQLDFIYKLERQAASYLFDLSLILHPNESIEKVSYESGDSSLGLKEFIYNLTQFTVIIDGGWDNCKSTLLFKVETNTKQSYQFTVLVTIISDFKNKVDIDKGQRTCRLWALDRNPEANYLQEDQEPWIEGDMILNLNNRYLWEYRQVNQQQSWIPLFVMNGVTEPVMTVYTDAQNPGERMILNQIHSDQGKIKSNGKGNLSVQGEISTDSIYTKAIIAGHPLGEGMLFTSQGMMAGHSLYVGSTEAKPKNIYIGMPGVVSAKLVSTDYLQIAPLSIKEIPTHVTKGTLILCYDYKSYSDLVLLYAIKDNPQSPSDWKPLFSTEDSQDKVRLPPRPASTSRPHLYPVSFNPNIQTSKSTTDNIVEIRPVVTSDKEENVAPFDNKHLGTETYTRFQFERENIPVTLDKKIIWKNLTVKDNKQHLNGDGQQYWSEDDHYWKAPADGLLHIQGWILFPEEQLNPSEPISYHAGDMFLLNIACNQQQKNDIYPLTQLELPLIPYVNDVTHQVCAHQQLPFAMTYPVEQGDKITFVVAYMPQNSAYGKPKDLSIKKAVITLFMS